MIAEVMAAPLTLGLAMTWTTTRTICGTAESLDLAQAIHIGHSTGGGEVARYVARHGSKRVAAVVLVGAVTPIMLQSATNPKRSSSQGI